MNILIVEDDDDKRERIEGFVRENFEIGRVMVAASQQSGLRAVLGGNFDLILLDMAMRNYDRTLEDDGGRPHHFAGREILRQMKREGIATPVIIVTHFERFGEDKEMMTLAELSAELADRFPNYKGTVQYKGNVDTWQRQLVHLIEGLGL